MAEELPVLQGECVTLRPFTDADIPPLGRIVSAPGVREWWIGYDEAGLRHDLLEEPGVRPFAIELGGAFIGVVMYEEELDPTYKHASVDITLDAGHLGRGLGTDALRTVLRYLIRQRGHHRVTIDPAASNARAIASYRKVGFKPIGIMREYECGPDGAWRDGLLMDLLAEELT
jgi:aminoglycoside 6'-N-acetyltransferase